MRRTITALALLLALCRLPAPATAGDEDLAEALEGLSGDAVLQMVKELAADGMKGRRTGFEGGTRVENWMIERFSEYGLHPADAGGGYIEPFTFMATKVTKPIVFRVGEASLSRVEDYVELTQTGGGEALDAEVVFCGYGIERPDLGWDDYAKAEVKGKVVMAYRGAPPGREEELREERFIGYKSAKALEKGAKGFLLVEKEKAQGGTIIQRYARKDIPGLWISEATANLLLQPRSEKLKELKKRMDTEGGGLSLVTGSKVTLKVEVDWRPRAKGHNVLGAIRGRDPDLVEEVVLVGAHIDHLGVGPDGTVFNGADDNASGTAVLTHLADVLTRNRWRPKRTIVFCGFGAEEQGLVGSNTLAGRYPFPGRVVCMLNMDMVGQGEPKVVLGGGGAYPAMEKRLRAALPEALEATTLFRPRSGPGSDQWPFYERGVPAFFVATKGPHPNYHTPEDDAANIKPACLEAAARTVGALIVRLGAHPEPLTDPMALPTYLLHEGPTFGRAGLLDVQGSEMIWHIISALDADVPVLTVGDDEDPAAQWKQLEELTKEKEGRHVLVRRVRDIQQAWRHGKKAVLPRLLCNHSVHDDPAVIAGYARLGYRWLAPWASTTDEVVLDAGKAAAIAKACRDAGVLVELPSDEDLRRHVLDALGSWPSVRPAALPPEGQAWPAIGPDTLLLLSAQDAAGLLGEDAGASQRVLWSGTTGDHTNIEAAAVTGRLATWGAKQPAGWDLPGSSQRKAIRAALGGRLVEWLRRLER